jgi:serine/threonine protein kinase
MARQSELAEVLIDCRVVDPERWVRAVQTGGRDLGRILDELTASPPSWWAGDDPPPPGLTEYQRWVIETRVSAGEMDELRRDLTVNQFLLLDRLGRGGQGEVYRGRQLNPPRFVAIKTLIQDSEARRKRFEQEARAMMRVRHPTVARFHLYERIRGPGGKPTDEYLIAMELVEGTDLYRLVNRNGPVPWRFAAYWTAELLGGLAEIHRNGFVHRDIKPENVMVVGPEPGPGVRPEDTAAKLLDFGAVRPASEQDRAGGRIFVGTREYAPSEQWAGEAVPASDLYALGGTLFFLLTGRPPFVVEGRDAFAFMDVHARELAPALQDHNPDVPEALDRLYQQMMEKDPARRGNAAGLAEEFERLLGKRGPAPTTPGPARPKRVTSKPPADNAIADRSGLYYRLIDPPLASIERLFLPGYTPLPPGREPPFAERLLALLRRPLVLLILAAFGGIFCFLLSR